MPKYKKKKKVKKTVAAPEKENMADKEMKKMTGQ